MQGAWTLVYVLYWMKEKFNEKEAATSNREGDDDVKHDEEALCTKDDDLKLIKAGGNKIRRNMTPPIFSSGTLDILLIE